MSARLDHHVALRVSDMSAAIRFWTEGAGGRLAMPPRRGSGGVFDLVFEPGCTVSMSYVLFDSGALELFCFEEPALPVPESRQAADAIMHFGITVPDVVAALSRIEECGGRRRSPVLHMFGRKDFPRFVYCESPDGHVFEFLETGAEGVVDLAARSTTDAPGG